MRSAASAQPRTSKCRKAGHAHVSRVRGKVRKVVGRKRALDGAGVNIDSAVQDEQKPVHCGLRRAAARARLRKGHTHRSTPGKGSADEEFAPAASAVSSARAAWHATPGLRSAPRFSKYMVKRAPVAWGDTSTAPCAFRLWQVEGEHRSPVRRCERLAGAPAQERSVDTALGRDKRVVGLVGATRKPRQP